MRPKIIGEVAELPITIDECRKHLEASRYGAVDSDGGSTDASDIADDTMIEAMLGAAQEHCENFLGLSLSTRTLEVALDSFPTSTTVGGTTLDLPMGPVREIESIVYGEESDALSVGVDEFGLDSYSLPARLTPIGSWPAGVNATNTIKVRYLAGYGVDSDGGEVLPKAIRYAILLTLGELYANRENAGDVPLTEIPTGAQALMRPLRVRLGMA